MVDHLKEAADHTRLTSLLSATLTTEVCTAALLNETSELLSGYSAITNDLARVACNVRQFAAARILRALEPELDHVTYQVALNCNNSGCDDVDCVMFEAALYDADDHLIDWAHEDLFVTASRALILDVLGVTLLQPALLAYCEDLTIRHEAHGHVPVIPVAAMLAEDDFCHEDRDTLVAMALSLP